MTTVEILKAARAKIADEKHWTKGAEARDVAGKSVSPQSRKAVCWCSLGALSASAMPYSFAAYSFAALGFVQAIMNSQSKGVSRFNDSHTHAEVLAAWDAAIADAEKAVTA